MAEGTEPSVARHQQDDCPTAEAFQAHPHEVHHDVDTGYVSYVGMRGPTHIFTPERRHHTSFHTTSLQDLHIFLEQLARQSMTS
jgi:hypothetical protein